MHEGFFPAHFFMFYFGTSQHSWQGGVLERIEASGFPAAGRAFFARLPGSFFLLANDDFQALRESLVLGWVSLVVASFFQVGR
jgi:hypothetical protein